MEIQNVTIEDAEELLDIYAPYVKYTAITFEYDVPSVEEFRQRIVNISNRYPYIKAVDNGQIVNCLDIWISRQLTMDRLSVMHMPDVLRTGEHMTGLLRQLFMCDRTAREWELEDFYMTDLNMNLRVWEYLI